MTDTLEKAAREAAEKHARNADFDYGEYQIQVLDLVEDAFLAGHAHALAAGEGAGRFSFEELYLEWIAANGSRSPSIRIALEWALKWARANTLAASCGEGAPRLQVKHVQSEVECPECSHKWSMFHYAPPPPELPEWGEADERAIREQALKEYPEEQPSEGSDILASVCRSMILHGAKMYHARIRAMLKGGK